MNLATQIERNEIAAGIRIGFWLVRDSDSKRFYISKNVSEQSLNKVCDKVLSDKLGWGYWIDYCMGVDVKGVVAWSNIDHTDRFI